MSGREDVGGVFYEAGARPPVPGQESHGGGVSWEKAGSDWSEAPRRFSLEPRDSRVDPMLALLDDCDGTEAFQGFLRTLGLAPMLAFWFACRGFRKVPEEPESQVKVARAIYRSFLCEGVVSCKVSPETRSNVRSAIERGQLDSRLFEKLLEQVQRELQEELFPRFLQSNHNPRAADIDSQRAGSEEKTRPHQSRTNQKSARGSKGLMSVCSLRGRPCRRPQEKHTHLPHTPTEAEVRMRAHTFAGELMRRLQELQEAEAERAVTVVYWYDGELIPHRTSVRCNGGDQVTLGIFKSLLSYRGRSRCLFQRESSEFSCGSVLEEIAQDSAVLPLFHQKIMARVERTSSGTNPPSV